MIVRLKILLLSLAFELFQPLIMLFLSVRAHEVVNKKGSRSREQNN
jgi:hypothetical protein